jgi:beta-phosphoglucomutase-like phosphatase (HAD superfamily)
MPPTTKPTETAKPVVVLFDSDETLLHTGGSGARSWRAAFDKLYGIPADIGEHSSAGETDPEVAHATFNAVLGRDPSDDELSRLYAQYLVHLATDIGVSEGYRVLPGAEKTLLRARPSSKRSSAQRRPATSPRHTPPGGLGRPTARSLSPWMCPRPRAPVACSPST